MKTIAVPAQHPPILLVKWRWRWRRGLEVGCSLALIAVRPRLSNYGAACCGEHYCCTVNAVGQMPARINVKEYSSELCGLCALLQCACGPVGFYAYVCQLCTMHHYVTHTIGRLENCEEYTKPSRTVVLNQFISCMCTLGLASRQVIPY